MSQTPRTLAAPTTLRGVGLFTEKPAAVTIHPAPAGRGVRVRFADRTEVPATIEHLSQRVPHPAFRAIPPRMTALEASPEGPAIFTIEHVLSALVGCSITDATLEVEGIELPIFDGSAKPFTDAIAHIGAAETSDTGSAPEPIVIDEPIVVERDGASVRLDPLSAPGDPTTYTYRLDYTPMLGPDSPISAGEVTWAAGDIDAYLREVAPARTFCLAQEAEQMRAMGLFTQLSPRDMLVYGPTGPVDNAERFELEPARHKLLDLIGDLALAGRPVRARITADRSGHALHHEVCRALLAGVR